MPYYQHIICDSSTSRLASDKKDSLLKQVAGEIDINSLPIITNVNNNNKKIDEIESLTKTISTYNKVYILGTGGSSLTGQALVGLTNNNRITFIENVDPHSFENCLSSTNLEDSFFIVISKSGKTLETLSQLAATISLFAKEKKEELIKDNFLIITDPVQNPLREISEKFGMKTIEHESDIGGRFSIFTNVGLLPAAISGLDVRSIIEGARNVAKDFSQEDSVVFKGALFQFLLMNEGYSINAFMPYIDRLDNFATWYRQLWAESIGKDGKGTSPLKAVGTIDQHSQLQLYLDGPKDKSFTMVTMDYKDTGSELYDFALKSTEINALKGKKIGDIMDAEYEATKETLIDNGAPLREFRLAAIDEKSVGALAMHLMLETIVTGKLMGIDPFNQPAVEKVKKLAINKLS